MGAEKPNTIEIVELLLTAEIYNRSENAAHCRDLQPVGKPHRR